MIFAATSSIASFYASLNRSETKRVEVSKNVYIMIPFFPLMEDRKAYLRVLRSPARKAILVYLAENGPSRFMDIKRGTGLSTGVIYHHLRSLEGFVAQDDNKMYRLTEGGMRLVSLLSSNTRQSQNQEETPDAGETVNDLLLEFYPTLVRAVSYLSLTQLFRKLNTTSTQIATTIASLEFVLLIAPHVSPIYSPIIGVYGYSVPSALITFIVTYIIIRVLKWLLTNSGVSAQDSSGSEPPITQKLIHLVEPELLSFFSIGLAITYLSFIASGLPLVGGVVSIILFMWGYVSMASAVSYTSGLEFIPSLLLPFTMNMFSSALDQALLEGYIQPMSIGFDLGMGALGLLVAAWADRSMKMVFGRRL